MSHILVDLDGVLADWGKQWDAELDVTRGAENIPRHHDQRNFNLKSGLTHDEALIVDQVMATMSYLTLEPMPGAIDALFAMEAAGHHVTICTTPWLPNATCASDKLEWVAGYLGDEWAKRTIITSDKTLVRGDYLIDDKPNITGEYTPEWQHILFDQPYNQSVEGKPRLFEWENWPAVIRHRVSA